jgi:hypothetical protein
MKWIIGVPIGIISALAGLWIVAKFWGIIFHIPKVVFSFLLFTPIPNLEIPYLGQINGLKIFLFLLIVSIIFGWIYEIIKNKNK